MPGIAHHEQRPAFERKLLAVSPGVAPARVKSSCETLTFFLDHFQKPLLNGGIEWRGIGAAPAVDLRLQIMAPRQKPLVLGRHFRQKIGKALPEMIFSDAASGQGLASHRIRQRPADFKPELVDVICQSIP
jgi:hypothetical protein